MALLVALPVALPVALLLPLPVVLLWTSRVQPAGGAGRRSDSLWNSTDLDVCDDEYDDEEDEDSVPLPLRTVSGAAADGDGASVGLHQTPNETYRVCGKGETAWKVLSD